MAIIDLAAHRPRAVISRLPARRLFAAAGLLLGSAVLQLLASLERWVTITESWTRTDHLVEDHRFDYLYPSDPWEVLGSTALLAGAGFLLMALAVVAMSRGASRFDRVVTAIVAASFAVPGIHALVSVLIGFPTPAQYVVDPLTLVSFIGLIVLAARTIRISWVTSLAFLLMSAITIPGYIVVAFVITPAITNFQSFDTTPWTETIVAAFIALAGLAMLAAAGTALLRNPPTRPLA
jgi:hypothetical protein